MTELGQWLMDNYYSKYLGNRTDVIPSEDQMDRALQNHQDKIVIVRDEKIKGVGIFVTLTDETYALLRELDITDIDILKGLLVQSGPNIHFIVLCADGVKTIMTGLIQVKRKYNPKTISWWNPDLTHLHVRSY
jgi:hypothetical protein